MVLKRSWPAVSHICSFTRLPSSSIVRILKSMPMVVIKDGVNESSLKRSRQHDLPTPESPIRRSLIWKMSQYRPLSVVQLQRSRKAHELARGMEGACARQSYKKVIVPGRGHVADLSSPQWSRLTGSSCKSVTFLLYSRAGVACSWMQRCKVGVSKILLIRSAVAKGGCRL